MPELAVAADAAWNEAAALLHDDFASFAACCFRALNPRTRFVMNWHVEVMTGKLAAVREGRIRRLMICVPPRHLKSHVASISFPAWCLGHDPSAQLLCACYAQDLADKLSRDCRRIVASDWYRKLFPTTRLSPQRQAVPEFETTVQGFRIATSVGGVLTGRGADFIIIDDPLKPEEALSQAQRQGGQRVVRPHPLQPAQRQAFGCDRGGHAPAARRRSRRSRAGAGGVGRRTPAGDCRGGRSAPGRDRVRQPGLWPQSR